MATKILLVDDHPLFVEGFASMASALRPDWRLQTAASAKEARLLLNESQPDAAVVDIILPDGDGIKLAGEISGVRASLPVVLISGRNDAAMHMRARATGARGFIVKTEAPSIIADMIDRVLSGLEAFSPLDDNDGFKPGLTPRQAQVLALLAEGHANKEIRHRLGIAERTVRAHITELFQFLGVHSRMQALIRARELGLIN